MKILVLKKEIKERALIREALLAGRHEAVFVLDAEQAWRSTGKGDARFVILDEDVGDGVIEEFVQRVRAADIPPIYFLLLSSDHEEQKQAGDVDDVLHKPYQAIELQMRLTVGQRILTLADNLSQARDQIEHTPMFDPLTGIMNQVAFNKIAKNELERARRASSALSIIALDIDNFKILNEKYGTAACDHLIQQIAENVRERSRLYDFIGRWTGAEFMLVLLNVVGSDAEKIARRIIRNIRESNVNHEGVDLEFSVSAGIAAVQGIADSTNMDALIEDARQALVQAKKLGGYEIVLKAA